MIKRWESPSPASTSSRSTKRSDPPIPPWQLLTAAKVGVQSSLITDGFEIEGPRRGSILPDRDVDIGTYGRMDANGFLYLL